MRTDSSRPRTTIFCMDRGTRDRSEARRGMAGDAGFGAWGTGAVSAGGGAAGPGFAGINGETAGCGRGTAAPAGEAGGGAAAAAGAGMGKMVLHLGHRMRVPGLAGLIRTAAQDGQVTDWFAMVKLSSG